MQQAHNFNLVDFDTIEDEMPGKPSHRPDAQVGDFEVLELKPYSQAGILCQASEGNRDSIEKTKGLFESFPGDEVSVRINVAIRSG